MAGNSARMKLSRMAGSIASGSVLSFEGSLEHARTGVDTDSMKRNDSDGVFFRILAPHLIKFRWNHSGKSALRDCFFEGCFGCVVEGLFGGGPCETISQHVHNCSLHIRI